MLSSTRWRRHQLATRTSPNASSGRVCSRLDCAPDCSSAGRVTVLVAAESDPVLYQGSDPDYGASGRWTVITLTKNINYNPAFEQSPSASWPPMAAPPIPSGSITRIYGVTRGSFDGIGGLSYIGQGWPAGPDFVATFAAWSGAFYS